MNQTIRNARAKTGVTQFKVAPLETNNQNWTLHKGIEDTPTTTPAGMWGAGSAWPARWCLREASV